MGDVMPAQEPAFAPVTPVMAGLRGHCPRCGKGHLFEGWLKLRPSCEVCGLDYKFADPADGPAFFAMMVMSFPATGFAMWLEITREPPYWVHLITTFPLMFALCVLPLRALKGWLVCSQYYYRAEEGRLAPPERLATSDKLTRASNRASQ